MVIHLRESRPESTFDRVPSFTLDVVQTRYKRLTPHHNGPIIRAWVTRVSPDRLLARVTLRRVALYEQILRQHEDSTGSGLECGGRTGAVRDRDAGRAVRPASDACGCSGTGA